MEYASLFFILLISNYAYPAGFVAGTLVRTQTGHVPIEQIKAGDEVVGSNENGFLDFIVTRNLAKQQSDALASITIDEETFSIAQDQKLFSYKRGWIEVSRLETGEFIAGLTHNFVINNIEITHNHTCAEVYSLSIFGTGIFFISMHDIAVYNSPHSFPRSVGRVAINTTKAAFAAATTIITIILCDKYGGKKS